MKERMKILELLEAGKITAEQAEALLAAIGSSASDADGKNEANRFVDKRPFTELKNIGQQVAEAVQKSLTEVKKSIDWEDWSLPSPFRVLVTIEKQLDQSVQNVTLETKNGRIKVSPWDESFVSVQVRGQVKTNDLQEAKRLLEQAVELHQTESTARLTISHSKEVGGAGFDVFIPRQLQKLSLKTHNGGIQVDSVELSDFIAETSNGSVLLYRVDAGQIHLVSHNGSIDVRQSVSDDCRSIYARTHNGAVELDGISPNVFVEGTAKTNSGQVDVRGDYAIETDDPNRRRYVRFRSERDPEDEGPTVQIFCETHNGSIQVRS